MRSIVLCSLIPWLCSCASLDPLTVQAERATYDAIAPEYRAYVLRDGNLQPVQKEIRMRTLDSWNERITAAEAP